MPNNRKKLITELAADLFRNKGYNATSMRDIADVVGVEAASLYNHIKSKSDLLQIIVFQIANICNEHLGYVKQNSANPAAQMESIIRFHVKLMLSNYNHYYVMTHDWKNLAEPDLTSFVLQRRNYVQEVENIVQHGIDTNIFKAITPYVVVLNILSAVMGIEFWHQSRKTYTETEIEENIVLHLLSGLLK
jgi:TetR/AcrR family transcriptional regulator, cholesterol catabolism regulator